MDNSAFARENLLIPKEVPVRKCLSVIASVGFLVACSHQALVPEGKNVKVQREDFPATCENLGAVEGRNSDLHANVEKAIEDLRSEAAKRGANSVRLEATSGYGNSVRGTAYLCR